MIARNRVLRFRPPRIALALVVIAMILHSLLPVVLHASMPVPAALTGVLGFVLMMRAWWLFRQAGTAIRPTDTSTTLITNDIYGLSRNPMYLAVTLMLGALALYSGAVMAYAATLANFAILNRHFVPFEEQKMRLQFGEEFRRYEQRVRRWL